MAILVFADVLKKAGLDPAKVKLIRHSLADEGFIHCSEERQVQGVLDRLRDLGAASVHELHGEPEDMVFALPKELRLRLVD